MAPAAQGPIAEIGQVETMRLMTRRTYGLARVKRALRPSFLVALRALKSHLSSPLWMGLVARDTVSVAFHGVRRGHIFVAALACCIAGSAHGVGFMTAAAIAVLAGFVLRQDLGSLVA